MPASDIESAYHALLAVARDAIVVVTVNEVISYANHQAETMFGYQAGELQGRHLECLIPERFRRAHHVRVKSFFENPVARPMNSVTDLIGRRKDGSELPIDVSIQPFISENGMMASAAIRDLTEQRKLDEQLREARALAAEAAEAKAQFLATMAHELRTPLHAILGFARLLQRDKKEPLSLRHQERAAHIIRGGEQLLDLIEDLLDPNRVTEDVSQRASEVTSVPVVLRELQRVLSSAETPASLEIATPTGVMPMIAADRGLYLQVLKSLAKVALSEGADTTLFLMMERVPPAWVRVSLVSANTSGDEPSGTIPPNSIPLHKKTLEGHELTSAQQLAESMGGSLTLWKTAAGTIRGTVDMPVHESSSISPPLEAGARRRHVLYLESDEAFVAFLRSAARTLEDIVIQIATNPLEAIEITTDYPPDLILIGGKAGAQWTDEVLAPLLTRAATSNIRIRRLDTSGTTKKREDEILAALEAKSGTPST